MRQHGPLEALGEVVLLLEEHRALEALGDAAAERHQEVAFLAGEAAVPGVEQAEGADGPALDDQGQIGARGHRELFDVFPERREAAPELLA